MRDLSIKLKNKTMDYKKLIEYGFIKENNKYILRTKIYSNQFEAIINITENSKTSKLIDLVNGDEYILVDIESAEGEFVGKLKLEYENLLNDIIEKCTNPNIFQNEQSKEIIKYIKEKYNDELEFLWEKLDETAIWRNKTNNKWYGLMFKLRKNKLGIKSEEITEVINLRFQKEKINEIIDNEFIFPGYHMNKNSWISIKLDNSLKINKIIELIDNSYLLSVGNKCGLAGNDLAQKVFDYLTLIPKGKVVTYKQVAEYLGNKGLARTVGNILHKNPDGDKYPCYKVLNSKGELADAFVFGGKSVQKERLEKEGIKVTNDKVNLEIYQWKK